jgi:hypothetical protein
MKNVVPPRESGVPSAARVLKPVEAAELGATAVNLPPGWTVTIEPPYGQLSLCPPGLRYRAVGCWIVDRERRVVTRERWHPISATRRV